MDNLINIVIGPVIRHAAGAAGAALATNGLIEASQTQTVSGAILTLLTVAVSIFQKYRTAKK